MPGAPAEHAREAPDVGRAARPFCASLGAVPVTAPPSPTAPPDGISRTVLPEAGSRAFHRESLLRIPLVRQMLADPQARLTPRAVDRAWAYAGAIPLSVAGFNPLTRRMFYGARSRLASWLRAPEGSARRWNAGDHLLHEVLFAVHDYLHVWAYLAICHLAPELGFGTAPLTAANLDSMAFCHLLSEAVATVGLDYWYLATVQLDEVCPIGTTIPAGLSISYHRRHLGEVRRADPGFDAQRPAFLGQLVDCYCRGAMRGFDRRDLDRSPVLARWLGHELGYGRTQRSLARAWLAYLAAVPIALDDAALGAPIACGAPWQRRLSRAIGALLREKVVGGVLHRFRPALGARAVWRARRDGALDFRFLNARLVPAEMARIPAEAFPFWVWQTLSAHEHARVDPRVMDLVPAVLERRDPALLAFLLRGARPLPAVGPEPRELLIPN